MASRLSPFIRTSAVTNPRHRPSNHMIFTIVSMEDFNHPRNQTNKSNIQICNTNMNSSRSNNQLNRDTNLVSYMVAPTKRSQTHHETPLGDEKVHKVLMIRGLSTPRWQPKTRRPKISPAADVVPHPLTGCGLSSNMWPIHQWSSVCEPIKRGLVSHPVNSVCHTPYV